jgi:hypothetical protein
MWLDSRFGWISAVAGLVLAWNLATATRIAAAPGGRGVRELSGLCGLLIVPAAIIAIAGSWIALGRTVGLLAWIWPLTVLAFVGQGLMVIRARRVTSFVVLPLFLLNIVLLAGAVARYASTVWVDLPPLLLGAGAAVTSVAGLAWGPEALGTPLALLLPVLSPAGPARWPGARLFRALLSGGALGIVVLVVLEYPAAVRAIASFEEMADTPMRERPRGDLALGLHLFPRLDRAPDRLAIRSDLPLADSLEVEVLAVTITPSGATGPALDSLADVVADLRADSVLLAVSLGWDPGEGALRQRNPVAVMEARLRALEEVVRRVRPDVVLPALDPLTAGTRVLGEMPARWWTDYFSRAGRLVHRLRPRTLVAVAASSWTESDSALYAWAATSPDVDLLGFSFAPGFRGGGELQAQLRVASRWMATNERLHWVTGVRTFPYAFGERAQQVALSGALAWASAQPRVRAIVIDGAGDHEVLSGLRRADGRLRPAVLALASAHRGLREGAVVLR